jgi:hypothetical protein
VADHPSFKAIDTTRIEAYSADQLRGFWKDLNKAFREICAKYRQSGQHDEDFSRFTRTRVDALYLWFHLKVRADSPGAGLVGCDAVFEIRRKSQTSPTLSTVAF